MYIAAKQASILNIRLVFNKYAVEDTFLFSMQFCPGMACPALPCPQETVFGLMTNWYPVLKGYIL